MTSTSSGGEHQPGDQPAPTRVALVTGANRGIGLAIAERLVADGMRVVGTTRSTPATTSPATTSPGIEWVTMDVTDDESVDAAFDHIEREVGPVEVLVANAGITKDGLALKMSTDDFVSVLDTNLTGAFRVARRAVRKMVRARTGRIIFVSSVSGLIGQPGQANYAASKAGLGGLARSLAREVGSRSITVNIVAPGPVATEMFAATDTAMAELLEASVPLGRLAEVSEVAAAVAFLASEDAGYITGHTLNVDGGLGMR